MIFKTHTLGCKVNIYESEALNSMLIAEGWQLTDQDEYADVHIINTCTVTATSDSKSRKMIRAISRTNNNSIIVVMGCYAQLNAEEVATLDQVAIVIGTKYRYEIKKLVEEYLTNKRPIIKVENSSENHPYEELKMLQLSKHTRGFVKVQDGCENFCAYCAIPYSRGPIKSRNPEDVIMEIKYLVATNVKEVIIAGINTGVYGQDLGNINLAKLIDRILTEIPKLYRLRLSSIELMEISDELLDLFVKYPNRLARHLHIPLQAGSDATLIRMHRKYLTTDYEKIITKIRLRFPKIAITTDCLAGFVGESETDFNDALQFISKMKFASMHVFPYSRRSGTLADTMTGHLPKDIIDSRTNSIIALGRQMAKNYQNSFVGAILEVLIEQKKNNEWYGHTSNYLEVAFMGKGKDYTNQVVWVKITHVNNNICYGEIIKEAEYVI